jgi:hypothetical protein
LWCRGLEMAIAALEGRWEMQGGWGESVEHSPCADQASGADPSRSFFQVSEGWLTRAEGSDQHCDIVLTLAS